MNLEKKYANMMYNYLLETLLEQGESELYIYVLTVLHTGLKNSDMLELTWEQLNDNKFTNVKLHKRTAQTKKEIREDILIARPASYHEMLSKVDFNRQGKMFSFKTKYAITPLLRRHTGIPLIYSHELRVIWGTLL